MTQPTNHLLNAVAPDPVALPPDAWTAENLLRYAATRGMLHSGKYPFRKPMPEKDDTEAWLRWYVNFLEFTGHFNLHLALSELREVDPERANHVANDICLNYDTGDSYGEHLWQWVTDHGIDAEALIAEHKASEQSEVPA